MYDVVIWKRISIIIKTKNQPKCSLLQYKTLNFLQIKHIDNLKPGAHIKNYYVVLKQERQQQKDNLKNDYFNLRMILLIELIYFMFHFSAILIVISYILVNSYYKIVCKNLFTEYFQQNFRKTYSENGLFCKADKYSMLSSQFHVWTIIIDDSTF